MRVYSFLGNCMDDSDRVSEMNADDGLKNKENNEQW